MRDKEDIFLALDIADSDKKNFKPVQQNIDKYFVVKRNVILEKAQLYRRIQKEIESVNRTKLCELSQ